MSPEAGEIEPPRLGGQAARRLIAPDRLVRQLVRLGPVFVKIGQYLALRPDILPQAYCDVLLSLSDSIAPEPYEPMLAVLRVELREDPAELFDWINPIPIGSASMAQVYRAVTRDGQDVAIKIQRPGLEARVAKDLARLDVLARILERTSMSPVDARGLMVELRRWLAEELDFTQELRNLQLLREAEGEDDAARLPKAYPYLSTRRVLTTGYLEGAPFTFLLQRIAAGAPEDVDDLGFDRAALARNLLETVLNQIFRRQVFHADLHPGNILALPHSRLGLVDFGVVERLNPMFRPRLQRYLRAVYFDDPETMHHALSEIVIETPEADRAGLKDDFFEQYRRWLRSRDHEDAEARGPANSQFMIEVLRAVRENAFRLPNDVLALYRSLLTAERLAYLLEPSANLASVGRGFFADIERDWLKSLLSPDRIRIEASRWADIVQEAPGNLNNLLSDVADGRFVLRVEQSESASARERANTRALLVSVAVLVLSASVLLAGLAGRSGGGWIAVQAGLSLALVLLLGWMVVLWRRLA